MESNNIDKLFKDKLASEEVEFNPAAWTAAEQMIALQSGKTAWYAGKAFLSIVAASLLTIGGTAWLLTNESSVTSGSANNIATTSNKAADEVSAIFAKETISNNATPNSLDMSTTLVVQESNEREGLPTEVTNNVAPIEPSNLANNNNALANPEPADMTTETTSNSDVDQPVVTSNMDSSVEITTTRSGSASATFEMNIIEKEIVDVSDVDLLVTEEIESEEDFSQPVELPINDRGLSILRNIDIRLILGGGAAWGFRNPQLADPVGVGYSPTAGFSIGYIANSEFSFDVNVLYRMRTGLSKEALILSTPPSDDIIAQSLHYLDVPFYLNYHSDRHSLQLGMQYSYLLTTRTEIINSVDYTSTMAWGKNNYFKNSDLAALIGYNFMLNEQLNIGARFNYGIFDVTGNQPSVWETNDKNIHFNFLLEYKLTKY
jgi:hypothetical protein